MNVYIRINKAFVFVVYFEMKTQTNVNVNVHDRLIFYDFRSRRMSS